MFRADCTAQQHYNLMHSSLLHDDEASSYDRHCVSVCIASFTHSKMRVVNELLTQDFHTIAKHLCSYNLFSFNPGIFVACHRLLYHPPPPLKAKFYCRSDRS